MIFHGLSAPDAPGFQTNRQPFDPLRSDTGQLSLRGKEDVPCGVSGSFTTMELPEETIYSIIRI